MKKVQHKKLSCVLSVIRSWVIRAQVSTVQKVERPGALLLECAINDTRKGKAIISSHEKGVFKKSLGSCL
jgi:hypothetical protein